MTWGADRLYEEITYVAYHLHWSLDETLDLEHGVRDRFVRGIADLNQRSGREG